MAHHGYIRGSAAAWIPGPVLSTELWAFDQAQYRAINGDEGGTWAPSAQIIIGGSGLYVTGEARLADMYECAVQSGNHCYIYGSIHVLPGGFFNLTGTQNVQSGGSIDVASGGAIDLAAGGTLYLANSGDASFLTYTDDITIIPAGVAVFLQGFSRTDDTTLSQDATPNQADHFVVPVPLTPAATVTTIRVHLDGVFGHGGEIQYPPKVRLYEIDTVGAQTLIDEQVDPELVSGNYENDHYFDLTGLSQTMGETGKSYQVRVYGEGGTNALAGTQFNAVRIFYQVSTWARY